jgi:hypothetical protein
MYVVHGVLHRGKENDDKAKSFDFGCTYIPNGYGIVCYDSCDVRLVHCTLWGVQ